MADRPRGIPAAHHPDTLVPVPTVEELIVAGYAYVVERGRTGTYYRITEEGRRRITEAMTTNANRRKQCLFDTAGGSPPAG